MLISKTFLHEFLKRIGGWERLGIAGFGLTCQGPGADAGRHLAPWMLRPKSLARCGRPGCVSVNHGGA